MKPSGSTPMFAPSDAERVSVATLQGYLGLLNAIVGACRQVDREEDLGSQAQRSKAILALCRQHVCGHVKRMAPTPQTAWERGLADLFEGLWATIHPMPCASGVQLIARVHKARRMASTLEQMLSSFIVLESIEPVDVEEALARFYEADHDIPF